MERAQVYLGLENFPYDIIVCVCHYSLFKWVRYAPKLQAVVQYVFGNKIDDVVY